MIFLIFNYIFKLTCFGLTILLNLVFFKLNKILNLLIIIFEFNFVFLNLIFYQCFEQSLFVNTLRITFFKCLIKILLHFYFIITFKILFFNLQFFCICLYELLLYFDDILPMIFKECPC